MYMSKLDQFITKYRQESGLLVEEPEVNPKTGALVTLPTADDNTLDAAEDVQEPATVNRSLTDIGYVTAVKDMVKLLSISPSDIPESEYGIFDDPINPTNAFEVHQKLRDMIDRYYT